MATALSQDNTRASSLEGDDIFALPVPFRDPVRRAVFGAVRRPLEGVLALRWLSNRYAAISPGRDLDDFLASTLATLGVRIAVADADLARVPASGPLVVVANHPFGGVEGIVLASVLRRVRPDVRVLANFLLSRVPELAELFIAVNPWPAPEAARANASAMRKALRWLEAGGVVAVFPAGEVAHLDIQRMAVADPVWSVGAARLQAHGGAPVLPVCFSGCNGMGFQLAGLVHPALRTALLPRQLANKRSRPIEMHIGGVIPDARLRAMRDPRAATLYLRERTHNLLLRRPTRRRTPQPTAAGEPIIEPRDPAVLAREVASLPSDQLLISSGPYCVCIARAPQIPSLLREIGRAREVTFRGVGEGTGTSIDIDHFDATYLHLFVWHGEARELVGAYRLGPTDEVVPAHGPAGMYTSTLFAYRPHLFAELGPALEMGRSFVCPAYQRSHTGLPLLWKGIAQYVVRHPRYRVLFGPVSISNEYTPASRHLIATYLGSRPGLHPLARLVRPRNPLRGNGRKAQSVLSAEDLDDLSAFVADIEPDRKGVPVLLRQYAKLGARPLGFNVDPDFSDVLDVLVLVDLALTDRRTLERFMGASGAASFLAHHQPSAA